MTTTLDFASLVAPPPDLGVERMRYRTWEAALCATGDVDLVLEIVREWDALRREHESWGALARLRFKQDTRDAEAKAARELCDRLTPKITELDVRIQKALLAHPRRAELETRLGRQAFALWETAVLAFDPAIEAELVAEAELEAAYTTLVAGADVLVGGEHYTISTLAPLRQAPERATREAAERALWDWFAVQRPEMDRIYGELVRLRTDMARTLGYADFTELGYRRMARTDWNQAQAERFRAEVREHVVPLAGELRRRQAERLGVDKLMAWDVAVLEPEGNPEPRGDEAWMRARAAEMFDAMEGTRLGEFFRGANAGGFLDLASRQGKAAGGFCTAFPTVGMPFVFANFNGTKHDVEVFTHEIGHAYQLWSSREQPLVDYHFATMEACEIHSMSLELLTWPHMELFFGPDATRFRHVHLAESLLFLPYGVAVDHFQHEVYARPEMSAEERHAVWRDMEHTYTPWLDWGDLAHPATGGRWQLQGHVYTSPFYYLDYTLAQTCALQLWLRAEEDRPAALAAYDALCKRGGEAPFQELARSAGITSPFDEGCLAAVVERARAVLDA